VRPAVLDGPGSQTPATVFASECQNPLAQPDHDGSKRRRKIQLDHRVRMRYHYDIEPALHKMGGVAMPDVLVRDVDESTLARLKEKAKSHGRSLGVELKLILEQAAKQLDMVTARELAEQMSRSLEGRHHTDSAELLREDRDQ
jgi:plasmid stability protein